MTGPIADFRSRRLPIPSFLAGYAELMRRFHLPVPLHHEMTAISPQHSRRREGGWSILPVSARPRDDTVSQLVFALKHEALDLLTLRETFRAMDVTELEDALRSRPTSGYLRRLCYLYEWLLGETLSVPDTKAGNYVLLLDPAKQYGALEHVDERRFRIRFNLPGTPDFCPLVRRTQRIDDYLRRDFKAQAAEIVASAPPEIVARAAAFLLLSDSRASFAIEGETPSRDRIGRWASVIGKAGTLHLSVGTLETLQKELIADERFVRIGLRKEGGFVGRHDSFGQPLPEHISANPEDLPSLLGGLEAFGIVSQHLNYHPVFTAAAIAFGFVYIHPFEDGNGRLHRFLLHHILAERRYTPEGIVFPISSAIFHDMARYKDVLESVSRPLLEWVEWTATERGNVHVENETVDYYRSFDATAHVEYLFRCIETVIARDLPDELSFLVYRDDFHRRATQIVEMPARTLDLLLGFLRQNGGRLSRRGRDNEFAALRPEEISDLEAIYSELFGRKGLDQADLFEQQRFG